jgi:hypothetical protein
VEALPALLQSYAERNISCPANYSMSFNEISLDCNGQ